MFKQLFKSTLKFVEVLIEAEYLSVDPYNRAYMINLPTGFDMMGGQVARVLESKNLNYKKDDLVTGLFGWRTHTIFNPDDRQKDLIPPYILPEFGNHPSSLGLGILGMPGYFFYIIQNWKII